ncbi:type VII secretion system-associated protein [Streptomyces parvulus]|uniref:type VII secretion system-associated protein n=1 Tax=Streptomyces parvulus TaxID=146923 RepID=UPI0034120D7E
MNTPLPSPATGASVTTETTGPGTETDTHADSEDSISTDTEFSHALLDSPEPPEEIVKAARLAPDHWLSTIDPGWRGEGVPPGHTVAGRWRSDSEGKIVEWEDNDAYRPSPEVLGWPEPTDPVDAALQRAVTGYGPAEDVAHALAAAELAVLTLPDGSLVAATASDGGPVIPAFTSSRYLNLFGALTFEHRDAAEIVRQVPTGYRLYLNPPSPAGAILETGSLLDVMASEAAPTPQEDPLQKEG